MTDLEQLVAARRAILDEIAAGPVSPDYAIDGQSVSWAAYRASLMDQLKTLSEQINLAGGMVDEVVHAVPLGTGRD